MFVSVFSLFIAEQKILPLFSVENTKMSLRSGRYRWRVGRRYREITNQKKIKCKSVIKKKQIVERCQNRKAKLIGKMGEAYRIKK